MKSRPPPASHRRACRLPRLSSSSRATRSRGTTAGNRTLGTPTNLSLDGEPVLYRVKQNANATGTLLWSPIYKFSGGTINAFTIGTTASGWNYFGFRYNAIGTIIDEQSSLKDIN